MTIPPEPRRPRRPRRDRIKIASGEPVDPDLVATIIAEIREVQVSSGFHLTADDESAVARIVTRETCYEQEREQILAELTAARGGPPKSGEPVNDNVLGLTDPDELHVAERRLVSCRLAELHLEAPPTATGFGGRLEAIADLIQMTKGKGTA